MRKRQRLQTAKMKAQTMTGATYAEESAEKLHEWTRGRRNNGGERARGERERDDERRKTAATTTTAATAKTAAMMMMRMALIASGRTLDSLASAAFFSRSSLRRSFLESGLPSGLRGGERQRAEGTARQRTQRTQAQSQHRQQHQRQRQRQRQQQRQRQRQTTSPGRQTERQGGTHAPQRQRQRASRSHSRWLVADADAIMVALARVQSALRTLLLSSTAALCSTRRGRDPAEPSSTLHSRNRGRRAFLVRPAVAVCI